MSEWEYRAEYRTDGGRWYGVAGLIEDYAAAKDRAERWSRGYRTRVTRRRPATEWEPVEDA